MMKKTRRFHRLSVKFTFGIALILLSILTASLFMNSQLAERYYLHLQTNYVRQTGDRLNEYLVQGLSPNDAVSRLEESEKVLIVYSEITSDYENLSNDLREKFRQKGLGFQKFWLWEDDYSSAVSHGYRFRLYQQDKLNYGILVEYIPAESKLYAIASIVPNAADFIELINRFSILLYAFSSSAAILLIYLLVKHITNPLRQIELFSQNISRQEYGSLTIKTHDELEMAAESMNQMSGAIQQYQKILLAKNEQMKQLLDDVAHDLKTPISLIGMYTAGIRDGLDDGTFLETILQQNKKMSLLVERLLSLSRIEQKEHPLAQLIPGKLLLTCIDEQKIFFQEKNLHFQEDIDCETETAGNAELITALFSNLLSNAAKYTSSGIIEVTLCKNGTHLCFLISNDYQNVDLDIQRIWEPFYIGEPSRSKGLYGTGLGLPIAKKIADRFGYKIQCSTTGSRISFEVIF